MTTYDAGDARLRIVPDASEFRTKLDAQLRSQKAEFVIQVAADAAKAQEKIDALRQEQERRPINQRAEASDQGVQVKCRLGPAQRDGGPRVQFLDSAGAFLKCHVSATDEVVVSDDCLAAFGEHHRVVCGELDAHIGVGLDGDALDLADLDTADAHEVAALQPGHVHELGVVGLHVFETELTEDEEHKTHCHQAHDGVDGEAPERTCQILSHLCSFPIASGGQGAGAGCGGGGWKA